MADKKLSDVTSVEDFDYFLGVKSNGDVQKMSKDSMKKVISELMSSFLQIDSPKNFIVSNPSNMETGIISIGDASREISKSEKLNEPSEDIPFIRGMDSNGNPIYIGTEQFSSVLAGLIGINSTVTTILQVGESVEIGETNTASIYLLSIRASASNTEYLATYILAWASVYAAGITKISEYSYTSNVTLEVSRTGTDKYKITYKTGNVSSVELKYSLRKLIL